MKRIPEETRYQIFQGENIYLIVTGTGGTKAMMAAVYLLTRFHAQKTDFLLSFGIGALLHPAGEFKEMQGRMFLARKIENASFKRAHYPDLLYATPLKKRISSRCRRYTARTARLKERFRRFPEPSCRGTPFRSWLRWKRLLYLKRQADSSMRTIFS